ncbi:hypothetical protein ABH935_005365 [Catenulispora sp. GAS73]|uniref:hypothetical protein n=1 Tax=Catenulispora sp. GAS73 TaxID=3156269 RepID=UPI003514E2AF
MANIPTTNGAPPDYDCADCEDTGTTELHDVTTEKIIDAGYCGCTLGTHLRIADDARAQRQIETANAQLGHVTLATLKHLRDALLALPTEVGGVPA